MNWKDKPEAGRGALPPGRLYDGSQERRQYRLQMELWEATMEGDPTYAEWQWAPADLLAPGAAAGSLCCELAMRFADPANRAEK